MNITTCSIGDKEMLKRYTYVIFILSALTWLQVKVADAYPFSKYGQRKVNYGMPSWGMYLIIIGLVCVVVATFCLVTYCNCCDKIRGYSGTKVTYDDDSAKKLRNDRVHTDINVDETQGQK